MKSVHLASWAGLAVLVAASASLADEATVWIGRTGAQQLKAHAHFAMPFEVHLSVFPALEGFATGDIGWHNAEMDEPGEDMYMLAQACDIRVTLAAIDPGLRVWFGLTELQAGQAMAFGSPFFDFHPIVQIPDHDAEPGTIFSATFVVQDASGLYSASEVLTLQFTPEAHVHCDGIDFNGDGSSFDPTDIDAFLSVFSEGPCVPETATCGDIDFNNDGAVFDPCDVDAFLLVFSEGPCTLCGV